MESEIVMEGNEYDEIDELNPRVIAIRARILLKQEKKKAMNFLTKLDRNRFTSLLDELANDLSKGINNYPANIIEAMQLAQTYRSDGKVIGDMTTSTRENSETAYVTNSYKSGYNKNNNYNKRKLPDDEGESEGNGSGKESKGECYFCKKPGHWKNSCPLLSEAAKYLKRQKNKQNESGNDKAAVTKSEKKNKEKKSESDNVVFVGIEVVAANKTSLLDEYDVLCDNQATINVFRNKKLLQNIRSIDDGVSVSGVGGSLDLTMKGDLPGFGEVYYHPDCLANILCFHDLAEQKLVRFDENKNMFIVNINEKEYKFIPKGKLYVYNARPNKRKLCMVEQDIVLVETVDKIKNMFTKRQQKDAALARQAQMRMGYPSVKDIVDGINKGRVLNLPISKSDFDNAERIWGKDMGSIVGKSTRKRPSPVEIEPTHISVDKEIILCIDIFYIGGLTFLLSVSRHLNMYMVSHLVNRKLSTLKDLVNAQVSAYKSKGF